MNENPGAQLLYRGASGLEKAMADTDAVRLIAINAEIIADQWDAWAISTQNLPILAWGMGARLWNDDWLDATKRQWTANQWQFQALRGTLAGIGMALTIAGQDFTAGAGGYDVLEALTAPQGFFASPDLTKDEWDFWVRQMPELRVKLSTGVGLGGGEFFTAEDAADEGGAGRDDGPALYGRRAELRQAGKPTIDLGMIEWKATTDTRASVDFEQISTPGLAGGAYVGDEDFTDDDRFVDADAPTPKLYSYQLDATYDHVSSQLQLSSLSPGMEPIDISYERVSDVGAAGPMLFVNDMADDGFTDDGSEAGDMLADRIYLLDPAIQAPMMEGVSFVDIDRVGYPPYRAELLVDLKTRDTAPSWFAAETAAAESFTTPENRADADRAMKAIVGAKAFRDKALADFAVCHPLAFGDIITTATRFGDQPRSTL